MKASSFIHTLKGNGINTCYGVPDSLLKSFCAYVADHPQEVRNLTAANEGNAIGLACGHYLATGRPALVYMQNSGQGNTVNPLLSLMDEEVYRIPVLLLIGWRGEPGIKDEPQHAKQGQVTLSLLETMGIEFSILAEDETEATQQIQTACAYLKQKSKPYALIARKNSFDTYKLQQQAPHLADLSREQAICTVAGHASQDDIFIASTGHISRELYEYRANHQQTHSSDFLTVGGMGHASSIALGIALSRPERRVICMDGDGAFLMHMGAAAIIGNTAATNLRHIVFNNSAHDSVGGQPTVAGNINIEQIAIGCGYKAYFKARTEAELHELMPTFLATSGPVMLEVCVSCGARSDLGRPKEKPAENKQSFMHFAEEGQAHVYPGALAELQNIINQRRWKKLLVFSTAARLKTLGEQFSGLLSNCQVDYYIDITPNPEAKNVTIACNTISGNYDAIIALGGGSVIDFAKLYRAASDNNLDLEDYFRSPGVIIRKTPLVAIPTTAGTGSEATRFAVVYINGEKYSLDAASVTPDYALADANLLSGSPQYLKASCGMDALAQAIEGYWACGATPDSDKDALEAIRLCCSSLRDFVTTESPKASEDMMRASYLAGKCISVTRTTAAHALSYKFTQFYGIPHGHAVALSLPGLTELHYKAAKPGSTLQQKMHNLISLLGADSNNIRQWFHNLYDSIGLQYRLGDMGINSTDAIVNGVNVERLSNNPLPLTPEDMHALF